MCFVNVMNFCKGNINVYINFDTIYFATYFSMCVYWIRFFPCFTIYFYVFKKLSVYNLNLVLCLHLAINSRLLFNIFSGNLYIIICIFSSKHKLHLPSKLFVFHEMEGDICKPQIYLLPRTPKTLYGTIETILVFEKQRVNL